MIREIVGSDFMDCRKVQDICQEQGLSKYAVRRIKREEGIKTVEVVNGEGEKYGSGLIRSRSGRNTVNEKYLERKLVKAVRKSGGLAPKFVSPGFDGVPDRIILLPSGHIAFAELKAPGKVMRPLQVRRKKQLEALGFKVYCIDNTEQISAILQEIGGDAE
jgi:VRR-NUC domain.